MRLLLALTLVACTGTTDPVATDDSTDAGDSALADSATADTTALDETSGGDSMIVEPTDSVPPADSAVDAGPPGVRFIGRFDTTDPMGPKFAWSGSAMLARFTGTAIKVRFAGQPNQFAVIVDGGTAKTIKTMTGTATYTLADALPAGEHTVLVHRRTEAFFGEVQFLGFVIDGGALLSPPPARARRLEVIGDSITCGYGNEGADQYCKFTADTENHYLTYAALAARTLEADLHAEAWSGIGMYRDYGGDTANTMPARWGRTLPEKTTSTWDTSQYVPHAVVINLGTNDFAKGDPGKPFETAYLTFVRRVRKAYPSAWIFPSVGPMLSGTSLTSARTYLNNVIATLKSEGDEKISLLEFATQSAADGYGCDWHPSLATNSKMAKLLEAELRSKLGW
jgi:lysophospholipase L1-like esterase